MYYKRSEKGQALILIALAAIGLFAFAALAIDGARVYSEKRHAQNAADTSVMAAALAYTRDNSLSDTGIGDKARERALTNGYNNDGLANEVVVTIEGVPSGGCPGNVAGKDITVYIHAYLDTTFARVIGRDQVETAVTATSRSCGFYQAPLFNGNAIVGLKPNDGGSCAVDTGNSNSKSWITRGGGVFSNGCLEHPNGTLTIPNDKCITTVGTANVSGGGTHSCVQQNRTALAYAYPADIAAMMPPDPCTGAITSGRYAGGGKVPSSGQTTFTNDIFCISDFTTLDAHIALTNATLYVTDTSFSARFNGGGNTGFFGTASTSGVYQGYYMIIKMLPTKAAADACDQYFDFRGNGNLQMVGTILAPSTCIDYRGNSTGTSTHSQMIFYRFTGNGNSAIDINYQAAENHQDPVDPTISLLR
ncbi:MAG TPA: Tad domain-containing protein [Anaerolineales bacterium]|nr:Tad domain-containing protein [Anaerolineales bacterium]